MKIIDRYIIRYFLMNFVILAVVMMSLFVLVDLIVDLDEFIKAGAEQSDSSVGRWMATARVAIGYYGPLLPLLYTYFSGLLVVAAMGFTLSAMQRNREMVTIIASGVSLFRIAAPILLVGFLLNLLVLPVQEFIVPNYLNELSREKNRLKETGVKQRPVYYTADERGSLLSAADFDPPRGQLSHVTILERDEYGIATRRISATDALWNEDAGEWELISGRVRTPMSDEISTLEDGAQSIEAFPTQLSPTVLRAQQDAMTMRLLSLSSLQSLQHNAAVELGQRRAVTQVIWSRFSMLVVNVLVLVMALPVFLDKQPMHYVAQAAQAAVLALGSWGGALLTVQISTGMLNPIAAAWLPVVLYLPMSAWMMQRVKS